MRHLGWLLLGGGLALAAPAAARAGTIRYLGPHPISPRIGKGMCYIEGPHVHSYFPHKAVLYVRSGPAYVFVGDPVEFEVEADAPRHPYYGHHPIFWVRPGPGKGRRHYCYIAGPHYHFFPPPPSLSKKFQKRGGVYWWVGGHPKWYRPTHWRGRALGRYYRRTRFPRPRVRVRPPPGWVGVVVPAPGVRVRVKPGKVDVKAGVRAFFGVPVPGMGVKVKVHGPRVRFRAHGPRHLPGARLRLRSRPRHRHRRHR